MLAHVLVPISSQAGIQCLLDAMVVLNAVFLAGHEDTPPLYESGVKYRREGDGELWQTIPVVLRAGHGDCEDLACWRAAELRRQGIDARATVLRASTRVWHVIVTFPGGEEDPSAELGMGRKR